MISPVTVFANNVNTIEAEKVFSLIKDGSGLWLVDVRGTLSYERKHIIGSVNITPVELKFKNLPKEKVIVLADSSLGLMRAFEAALMLSELGYEKVFVLDGGIFKWEQAGYPLVVTENELLGKVMARELREAISKNVAMDVFDLRDDKLVKEGRIENSKVIKGKTFDQKIESLKKIIDKSSKKSLKNKLMRDKSIVLIIPEGHKSEEVYIKLGGNLKKDLRFIDGGYKAWVAGEKTSMQEELGNEK